MYVDLTRCRPPPPVPEPTLDQLKAQLANCEEARSDLVDELGETTSQLENARDRASLADKQVRSLRRQLREAQHETIERRMESQRPPSTPAPSPEEQLSGAKSIGWILVALALVPALAGILVAAMLWSVR